MKNETDFKANEMMDKIEKITNSIKYKAFGKVRLPKNKKTYSSMNDLK